MGEEKKLSDLTVGDDVVFHPGIRMADHTPQLRPIDSVGASYIGVDGVRYNRQTGRRSKKYHYDGHITAPTEADYEVLADRARLAKVRDICRKIQAVSRKFSVAEVNALKAILDDRYNG